MRTLEVREELVEAIKDKGEDVTRFANKAIEDALKPKRAHPLYSSGDYCFSDEHCGRDP
jgi:hypothetical protein